MSTRDLARMRQYYKRKLRKQGKLLGHHTNKGFYIVIVLLVIVILAIIIGHFGTVKDLQKEHQATQTELAFVESELEHYKQAYEIALADARALGRIQQIEYGMQAAGNETNASEPRTFGRASDVKRLPDENVWLTYSTQGFVTDTCIPTTKVVQTPKEEVEIVVIAAGVKDEEWPELTLLVDGTVIEQYIISEEEDTIYKTSLYLPKGTHYLDLLYENDDESKSVRVSLLRIGDRTLETDISIIDQGSAFGMFDCEDVKEGDTMKKNGAMRFRIEKV